MPAKELGDDAFQLRFCTGARGPKSGREEEEGSQWQEEAEGGRNQQTGVPAHPPTHPADPGGITAWPPEGELGS